MFHSPFHRQASHLLFIPQISGSLIVLRFVHTLLLSFFPLSTTALLSSSLPKLKPPLLSLTSPIYVTRTLQTASRYTPRKRARKLASISLSALLTDRLFLSFGSTA
ncbi:hypothetical protein L218DRAFT_402279 [Marasmius fiardii PR-910]|nr:hypothetical protein L218DRAFT_402279 [Marasmius fiardii PR-910]